jgi:hypothetical protein
MQNHPYTQLSSIVIQGLRKLQLNMEVNDCFDWIAVKITRISEVCYQYEWDKPPTVAFDRLFSQKNSALVFNVVNIEQLTPEVRSDVCASLMEYAEKVRSAQQQQDAVEQVNQQFLLNKIDEMNAQNISPSSQTLGNITAKLRQPSTNFVHYLETVSKEWGKVPPPPAPPLSSGLQNGYYAHQWQMRELHTTSGKGLLPMFDRWLGQLKTYIEEKTSPEIGMEQQEKHSDKTFTL